MSIPEGRIYLIAGAPVDNTYQHTIDFKNRDEQLDYWLGLARYSLENYTYTRRERRTLEVNKTFDELEGVNYLLFRNKENSKWQFCFITDREYIGEDCTRLIFDIDVIQTYLFDFEFKPSYISQGHVDRWTADKFPIYSRTDEGLAYGSEYVTEAAYKIQPKSEIKHGFYLIYLKPINNQRLTHIETNPIPYHILLVPNLEQESEFATIYAGQLGVMLANLQEIFNLMSDSAFGEMVQQIVYTKYLPFPYTLESAGGVSQAEGADAVFMIGGVSATIWDIGKILPPAEGEGPLFESLNAIVLMDIPDVRGANVAQMGIFEGLDEMPTAEMWEALKAAPYTTERDRRFESKLLCHPYRYNIFTDWQNVPVIIKNEYLSGDKITIKNSMGFGFNIPRRYWIANYRKDPEGREASITQPMAYDQPVISDAYYSYLLQNRNQISQNIANAKTSAYVDAAGSAIKGGANGAAGGPAGAIAGALLGGASSAINSGVNISNMIKQENAKQADLKNLPDTVSSAADTTLAIADDAQHITFYRKKICCEFTEQLAQYWHMYGYKVNRVETPNLKSRVRYNFIKTVGANITGPIESNYLAAIKAIFDAGITLWHYIPNHFKPLDYSFENAEVNLID